jgi:hypothetical protein
MKPENMTFRDSREAFEDAIALGVLSDDPTSTRYAGKFMYMGTHPESGDAFKNIDRRNYLYVYDEIDRSLEGIR